MSGKSDAVWLNQGDGSTAYFIHKDGVRFELPQIFFMRVAMGLAIEEKQKEDRAIEFYNLLSSFDYMAHDLQPVQRPSNLCALRHAFAGHRLVEPINDA